MESDRLAILSRVHECIENFEKSPKHIQPHRFIEKNPKGIRLNFLSSLPFRFRSQNKPSLIFSCSVAVQHINSRRLRFARLTPSHIFMFYDAVFTLCTSLAVPHLLISRSLTFTPLVCGLFWSCVLLVIGNIAVFFYFLFWFSCSVLRVLRCLFFVVILYFIPCTLYFMLCF